MVFVFHQTIVMYPPIVRFMAFVFHQTIVMYPPIVRFMVFFSHQTIVMYPPIVRFMGVFVLDRHVSSACLMICPAPRQYITSDCAAVAWYLDG